MNEFFSGLFVVLSVIGALFTAFGIGAGLWTIWLTLNGMLPVLLRLGRGLSGRKIAVLAKGDALKSLCALLEDCSLFADRNIIQVSGIQDLGRAERCSVMVLEWNDWGVELEEALRTKADQTALVVYADAGAASIPPESLAALNRYRNVTVCNFRGRLLNDLILAMVTTAYEKK